MVWSLLPTLGRKGPSSHSNVGISGFLSVPAGLHSPLSHPSLQSSLSNPNLQASLSSPQPQLQGSHSHPSLPASSLARHALPSTSLGHPSLSAPALSSSSSSSSASSPVLGAPPYPASTPGASPRHRRVPLSPLSLPAGPVDARRPQQQLPKQFSPTMSPTLSSITQVCVAASPPCLSPSPVSFPAVRSLPPSFPHVPLLLTSCTPCLIHPLPCLSPTCPIFYPSCLLSASEHKPWGLAFWFKSWPHLLLAVSLDSGLTSVSLSILLYKTGMGL